MRKEKVFHLFSALIFILFLALPAKAGTIRFESAANPFNNPPAVRLLYPIYDTVTLTGRDYLEFRWFNDYVGIDHFIFGIYKGYNMYGKDLLHKQDLPPQESSVKIKSDFFEDGQVYSWSLIQVISGGQKSDKSFNSFKVIKK